MATGTGPVFPIRCAYVYGEFQWESGTWDIIIEQTDSGFSAYSPDVPGCIATGATREATEREMRDAVAFHLEGLKEEVPDVRRRGGNVMRSPPLAEFVAVRTHQGCEPAPQVSIVRKLGELQWPALRLAHGSSDRRLACLAEARACIGRAKAGGQGQNRTVDTTIFSRMLYQLSYLARRSAWDPGVSSGAGRPGG